MGTLSLLLLYVANLAFKFTFMLLPSFPKWSPGGLFIQHPLSFNYLPALGKV